LWLLVEPSLHSEGNQAGDPPLILPAPAPCERHSTREDAKHHFLPPLWRGRGFPFASASVNDDTASANFGLACFGFLASRLPCICPFAIMLSSARDGEPVHLAFSGWAVRSTVPRRRLERPACVSAANSQGGLVNLEGQAAQRWGDCAISPRCSSACCSSNRHAILKRLSPVRP
jgi:hypothetical protein